MRPEIVHILVGGVPVLVMQIGDVGMLVGDALVPVPMRVLANRHRIVEVGVVAVVVAMRVLVIDGLVDVHVRVRLGQMKEQARGHREGGDHGEETGRLAEHPRDCSAPERPRREHGRGPSGAEEPLRSKIEPEAHAVSGRADGEQPESLRRRRPPIARDDGERGREDGADRCFGADHRRRVERRERLRERVVDRPRERGRRDRREADRARRTALVARMVEHEEGSSDRHDRGRDDDAPPGMLGVDDAREREGEDSLEVQHQRGGGPAGTREPPGQQRRRDEGAGDGDAHDSRQMHAGNGRLGLRPRGQPYGRGARIKETRRGERPRFARELLHERRRQSERDRREECDEAAAQSWARRRRAHA